MIPSVDPDLMLACFNQIELAYRPHTDLGGLIAVCALQAAGGDKQAALPVCQRVEALIATLRAHPVLLVSYGPQPQDRIPTELRRAAGTTPLTCPATGFDLADLRLMALSLAPARGSA